MNRACIKILTIIGMAGMVLAGCSNKDNSQTTSAATTAAEQETAESKSLADIYAEIEENTELPKMVILNDNYINTKYMTSMIDLLL